MSRRQRRDCELRLRRLAFPPETVTMAAVVDHVSVLRSRPILLRPFQVQAGGPSGAWLPTSSTDYIFYAAAATARHQNQIIGHELGHLVSAHSAAPHGALAALPLLAVGAAEVMLAREAYTSEEERAAEQMADLLVAHVERAAAAGAAGLEAALRRQTRT